MTDSTKIQSPKQSHLQPNLSQTDKMTGYFTWPPICSYYVMTLTWIKLNFKFLFKKSGILVGTLYSILGFIATWCSLENIFSPDTTTWCKIAISSSILLGIFILSFIGMAIWYYFNNSVCVLEKGNGKKVYVRYGDFIKELKRNGERRNFIIPANRCFDTIVDDRIISTNTIHGQFLKHIYSTNLFSPDGLSSTIERKLLNYSKQQLTYEEKPAGNKNRYPIGTIVDIGSMRNNHYYLLGLTTFDQDLTAHTSKEDFILAIQRMIIYCNKHSQGYPVVLPLIGSGLARTNISKNEVLKYLIRAFEINKDIINCDFHIVVWEKDKENTTITNLK